MGGATAEGRVPRLQGRICTDAPPCGSGLRGARVVWKMARGGRVSSWSGNGVVTAVVALRIFLVHERPVAARGTLDTAALFDVMNAIDG